MRNKKKIIWLVLLVFAAIQFIRPARNNSGQVTAAGIQQVVAVPQNVQVVLEKACYDCHSNTTTYPWYVNIQPVGWFMAHHINEGKEELNFSEFGSYSLRRQQNKLKSIASQVKEGEMPLFSYTLIHRNAVLSDSEKTLIINWATSAKDSLSSKR